MKVLIVVCDGLGTGDAPDAEAYGDEGSNTLVNTAAAVGGLSLPNLAALGIGALGSVQGVPEQAEEGTFHGRLIERSAGKDSATGHWELCGVVLDRPFPTYPEGFPREVIEAFEAAIGRETLGNIAASGTEIIERLGREHLATGKPIVYTSGDSVFQVACHEDVAPQEQLWDWCASARAILTGSHAVGRVIARPFRGEPGAFERTPGRRDFSSAPPQPTLLDACAEAGVPVYAVGKIGDVFSMRGVSESEYSDHDDHGVDLAIDFLRRPAPSLTFVNLVDFDSKYGHRNDAEGFARCLERFDARVDDLRRAVGEGFGFITGDHGCDPTTPSTDHSRETVPVLGWGSGGRGVDIGLRQGMGDLGVTVGELLGADTRGLEGSSFADRL